MPLPILELSKYLLIGIIWLIFLRIVRAIWVEVRQRTEPAGVNRPDQVAAEGRPARMIVTGRGSRATSDEGLDLVRTTTMTLRLRCKEGPFQGQEFLIDGQGTIGRSLDATIPVTSDSFASSLHARITVSADGAFIEDLGSTNGTRVNHELIRSSTRVGVNDLISLGKSVFQVVSL